MGHVAKYYGIEPIDRSNTKKAIKSLKKVEMEIMNNKLSFLIAPEGTRSKDGVSENLKKELFTLPKNTGASIVPVIINGAYEAKNIKDWRLRPGTIDVHFSDSISAHIYKDMSVEELRDYVRGIIKGVCRLVIHENIKFKCYRDCPNFIFNIFCYSILSIWDR